nr:hypothetical protein [Tanacetum cinerariifolium]
MYLGSDKETQIKSTKRERVKIVKGLTSRRNSPWVGRGPGSDKETQTKCTCSMVGWHRLKVFIGKTANLVICRRWVRAMGRWSMFIFPVVGLNQANVVRYERVSKNVKSTGNPASNVQSNKGSYATAVRGTVPLTVPRVPVLSNPAVVLDESCVISRDLACHVMGKVKDIESIPNLRTLLSKEGFPKVKLSYLGGLWVMIELENKDFVSEERVVWVDIEGVPLNLWSRETFLKIRSKWGSALDIEDNFGSSFACKRIYVLTKEPDSILEKFKVIYKGDKSKLDDAQLSDRESDEESDVDGVSETVFGENSSSHHVSGRDKDIQQSEDPFCLYDLLKKHPVGGNRAESPSLSHPPGFTPGVLEGHKDGGGEDDTIANDVEKEKTPSIHANVMNTNIKVTESSIGELTSIRTGPVHNGGSILDVLEDMVRVGHSMGYNLEGCMKDIESVIGAQGVKERSLWDYISSLLRRWNGDSIVMGDFNDVRCKEERLGSLFNPLGARLFNQFINSSGLVEVKLEDHRPILLHEIYTDYGLTPFCFYLSWFRLDGFDDMALKPIIRCWVKERKSQQFGAKNDIVRELGDIDKILDHGNVFDTILLKRMELMRQLHDLNQVASQDVAQKSKIKWAIERDENSKFFHGIINKKRSYLSIRGAFFDGIWCTDPVKVKDTFKDHFQARFEQPSPNHFKLSFPFTKRLSPDQVVDMDSNVSRNEIRKAVWDCVIISPRVWTDIRLSFFGSTGVLLVQTSVVRLNIFLSMDRSRRGVIRLLLL